MASVNRSPLSIRQIHHALRRGAKDVLVANGIQPSTRRGSKELTLAVQRLAQQSYGSLDEATQAGQALGQTIAERSQAQGKTDLDGGIVRQMMLTGEIPTVTKVTTKPAKTTPVVVAEPKTATPKATPISAVIDVDDSEGVEPVEPTTAPDITPVEAIAAEAIATDDSETLSTPVTAAAASSDVDTLAVNVLAVNVLEAEAPDAETPDAEISEPEVVEAIEPANDQPAAVAKLPQAEADDDEPTEAETEVAAVTAAVTIDDGAKAESETAGAAT